MVANRSPGAFQTVGQVVRWWELRRLVYNAALLVVGAATIAGYEWLMTKLIPLGEDAIEPMGLVAGVVVYAGMANLCYTLGWVVELRSRKTDPVIARRRGQWMFRAGLLFSCVLTSGPFWFACLMWGLHRVRAH
jgi:hypothetical protein